MLKTKYLIFTMILSAGILFTACEERLDIEPENQVSADQAVQTQDDLQMLLNSVYSQMQQFMGGKWQRYSELMGDNVEPSTETNKRQQIYNRSTSAYFTADDCYTEAYKAIARANEILALVDGISMSDEAREQFKNEAYFLRAFSHFQLVRMFAQPYGYTSDNSHLGIVKKDNTAATVSMKRNTVKEIYDFVIVDLTAATNLPNENGNYATSWAAEALLAEVYFQMGDYNSAFSYANNVIETGPYVFDSTFALRDSLDAGVENPEWIFHLVSSDGIENVGNDLTSVFRSDGDNNPNIRVDETFYRIATNNSADQRSAWYVDKTDYYALAKYNYNYIDVPLLYLTPLKLLRAEAALLKDTEEVSVAIADVNAILYRAFGDNSQDLPADANSTTVLSAVREQKRLELVGEGHRVHDMKRIGSTEDNNILVRGVPWDCPGMALQFPSSEMSQDLVFNEEGGC